MVALFWLTRWGASLLESEYQYRVDLAEALASAVKQQNAGLTATVAKLAQLGDFGAANDPIGSLGLNLTRRHSLASWRGPLVVHGTESEPGKQHGCREDQRRADTGAVEEAAHQAAKVGR